VYVVFNSVEETAILCILGIPASKESPFADGSVFLCGNCFLWREIGPGKLLVTGALTYAV
jgi:hypothetical protein